MNAHCYKIVFSKRLGSLVAVGEHTTGQGKAAGNGVRTVVFPSSVAVSANDFVGLLKSAFASVALSFVTVGVATAAGPAVNTLPIGYSVNSGNVAISSTSSATNATMNITQTTDKASVNWNSFNIGSAARVNVLQNSANSVLLNRVVGNDPSQIFGKLSANGQVILINPNGIVFGSGGSVTASAFTASTFGLSDADLQAGKYKYIRNGSTAGVTVESGASLNATAPGGYVALMGASVNNQGLVSTQGGAVVMASGESVALPVSLTNNVSVPLSGKVRLELLPSTINAMVALSFASYLSMYPLLLLPPLVLLAFDRQPEKRWATCIARFAAKCVVVVAGCLGVLLGMSFALTGNSWEFLARTYGIQLTLSDLTPNVGLWWYFFIEMFDSFRAFFLAVFWLHLSAYVGGLSIRLRAQPLVVLTLLLGIFAIFKPYPSISDTSLFLAMLPLYGHVLPLMRYTYVASATILYATFLGPAFYHLWIYAGSGNANFFYAITLVWSLGQSLLVSDLTFAVLRDEWEVERPEMTGKEVKQI